MRNGTWASQGHVKGIDATNDKLEKEEGHKKKPINSGKLNFHNLLALTAPQK
jgi:hypothetical protein